jgi:hypothetical protein
VKVFKPSKVAGELHRFLQGVQKAFENNLSLEREIVLSVKRIRGLAEVLKMEKSPIVEEETGGRRSRSWEKELQKVCGSEQGSSRSREE